MRELVFVHGRAQEHKEAVSIKREWMHALKEGLRKSGLSIPIPDTQVHFPYYGQTLFDLVAGVQDDQIAEVIVRGAAGGPDTDREVVEVLQEILTAKGVSDEQIFAEAQEAAAASGAVVERGPLNWSWVRGILSAIDRYVPGASGNAIALVTRDVFQYLRNPGVRDVIDTGVRNAMTPGVKTIVVGHSLGTVVSYNLLRREGQSLGWHVPLYITLGAPLAVSAIRDGLKPLRYPACVGSWYNARDKGDVVSLYPLDNTHFPVAPPIENTSHVENTTANQHGISGYLSDGQVARRIHDALIATD